MWINQLLTALKDASKPLSELKKVMTVYPQELMNVEVAQKPNIETVTEIQEVIRQVETELGDRGRVLVRYSGTQPVCRVMVEGPSVKETRKYSKKIAAKQILKNLYIILLFISLIPTPMPIHP